MTAYQVCHHGWVGGVEYWSCAWSCGRGSTRSCGWGGATHPE